MIMNRIAAVLAEKQLKKKDLAELVDRSPNTIARICRNESQPNLSDLFQMANALKVDVRDLLVPNEFANERRNER